MSATKKKPAPKPPGTVHVNGSNGSASVGDAFHDKTIELTVVLPDQSQEKIHIVPSTALFDLRTQLCGKYKLNHSSHKLEPVDENGRAISCTSSSTVESSKAVAVHLIPRMKDTPKIMPIKTKTVEQTVRLTVKTSQAHQQVVRVKPNVPIHTILGNILEKTNISKENHKHLQLRNPLKMTEALDLSKSLDEYNKLREVFVVDIRENAANVSRGGSTKKKGKLKKIFKFGRKKSKSQIDSPTSPPPPEHNIVEAPTTYNEKGVDTGVLESKRPEPLKQPTRQQSGDAADEDESTEGKKKAPAPPAPTQSAGLAVPSSPSPKSSRPEKPPRRQSIEQTKEQNEVVPHEDEDAKSKSLPDEKESAIAPATASVSLDDVSISSEEDTAVQIKQDEPVTEKVNPQDATDSIKISEDKTEIEYILTSPVRIEDNVSAEEDKEKQLEMSVARRAADSSSEEEEEVCEEVQEVVEAEEPKVAALSDNADVVNKQSLDTDVPQVAVDASHHVISTGLAINDGITQDQLCNLSDSEIPAVLSDDSETDDEETDYTKEEIPAEREFNLTAPVSMAPREEQSPSPPVVEDHKPPSPMPDQQEDDTMPVVMKQASIHVQETKPPSPKINQERSALSPPLHFEEAASFSTQEQPPPLDDDSNLFTTPQNYNVYEQQEDDMAAVEAQAMAMLQKFMPPPQEDVMPPAPVGEELASAVEPERKIESIVHAETEEAKESDDEQTSEEIEKIKEEIERAKQKLAQKKAESEKNSYIILPKEKPAQTTQFGNAKTFTFVPKSQVKKVYENYETAPQTVISLSQGGEIRGEKLVKESSQDSSPVEKPSPPTQNEKIPEKPISTNTPTAYKPNPTVQNEKKTETFAAMMTPASFKPNPTVSKVATPKTEKPKSFNQDAKKAAMPATTKDPTPASIMVDYLKTKPETPKSTAFQPNQATSSVVTSKATKGSWGYVNSAIMKQPVTANTKTSVPPVYDWTSSKKSTLPNYYKRFLGIEAVMGTKNAVDKFKANVEDKKNVPNGNKAVSTKENTKPVVHNSPASPTKPTVADKPSSLGIKSSSPPRASQTTTSPVAYSLNEALNPRPGTALPLPPEEKGSEVMNYHIDETPLPPPPEEFLSPTDLSSPTTFSSTTKQSSTATSPTSPKSGAMSPGYVGISAAKPFGSSSSGGPKFRPMYAAFKSGKSNKPGSP